MSWCMGNNTAVACVNVEGFLIWLFWTGLSF